MAWRALQKRLRGLFSSGRQQSPCSSPSGQLCAATTGAAERSEKVQGRLHRGAPRGDLAWRRYDRRVGIDPPDEQRRTVLAVTTSHEADMDEDKLRLQKELEKVKLELQEMEEKNLNSERCFQNFRAAVEEKEREELGAAQELQDQLSVHLDNQTTVEQLEEHVLSLEVQNTRLEATVDQQNNRTEDLLRDLQASPSLQEMEEKNLSSEHGVQNFMAALNEKDKELGAAQELQDQLSAHLDNQTAVKQLEEHVLSLEIENARLEATVDQQNNRTEDLLRDLQASPSLQEMEEKNLNSERCFQNFRAAVEEKEREELGAAQELQDQLSVHLDNQTTVEQLEEHVLSLEVQNTRLEATVDQQNNRTEDLLRDLQASPSLQEMEQKYLICCVQNLMTALEEKERETTISAMKLQGQVLEYLQTVKQLEELAERLEFENTCLVAAVQQQSKRIEALQRDLQASASAQAVSQDFIKQRRARYDASLRNQLEDRRKVEKYKERYLEEVKTSKCQAKEVERANGRLEEANANRLWKRLKRKLSITSRGVSGDVATTPVLHSTALGHPSNRSGLNSSLSAGDSFQKQCGKYMSSRQRLVASVAKVQQEQEEKFTNKLEKATARRSKKFHLPQDPLCRGKEKHHDVLKKHHDVLKKN